MSSRSESASGFSGALSNITLTMEGTVFLPGDFDDDGGDLAQRRLALWEDNFGVGGAALASSAASVPEPSSIALLAFGALGLMAHSVRRFA